MKYSVKQYSGLHKRIAETPSKKAIKLWEDVNIISGQAKDSIPSIKTNTMLSPEFIKWAKEKYDLDLDNDFIDKIESEHKDIMDEYVQYELDKDLADIEAGKRKRGRLLTPYVKYRWGEKKVFEFMDDLENNLKLNKRYKANYERNKKLLLFSEIDEDVIDAILKSFPEKNMFLNTVELMNILNSYHLYKVTDRISDF